MSNAAAVDDGYRVQLLDLAALHGGLYRQAVDALYALEVRTLGRPGILRQAESTAVVKILLGHAAIRCVSVARRPSPPELEAAPSRGEL
jgi:hypothetical protein